MIDLMPTTTHQWYCHYSCCTLIHSHTWSGHCSCTLHKNNVILIKATICYKHPLIQHIQHIYHTFSVLVIRKCLLQGVLITRQVLIVIYAYKGLHHRTRSSQEWGMSHVGQRSRHVCTSLIQSSPENNTSHSKYQSDILNMNLFGSQQSLYRNPQYQCALLTSCVIQVT